MAKFVQKFKDMWMPPEDDYDYDFNDQEKQEEAFDDADDTLYQKEERDDSLRSGRVGNVNATAQIQVVLFKPENYSEDTRPIADELLKMHTVVLNLEGQDKAVSRRILDFISGVAYANSGKVKRIATSTFIVTPYNVDFAGDELMDELESNGLYF